MRRHTSRLSSIAWVALVFVTLLSAAGLRFYGLDWDAGMHLHPDERYLTMVATAVRFPGEAHGSEQPLCEGLSACLSLYWDSDASPLNPANHEAYAGYVYGTLPLFITRAVGSWIDTRWVDAGRAVGFYTSYNGIHLIGRALSAVMDLAALAALIGIGWALYDRWTGLLAGALYAVAVLPIQHAHFFVVDSFATVFVVWALLCAVVALRRDHPGWLLPAGLATGLAVASKISVWPLAGIVALTAWLMVRRSGRGGWTLAALMASGLLAALAFRTAQPYAFTGPGLLGVRIHPRWLSTMREVSELMAGRRDVPYGHQWTARTPVVFPWINMVFWGLGLPLGLMAWVGWGAMGWTLLRGDGDAVERCARHLIPWSWGTLFFLYQGTQWVKSMRYLLPVYPVFVLFAAWATVRWVRKRRTDKDAGTASPGRRLMGIALPALLVGTTALWAWAFVSIYARPVTRIEASRWLFENVPTAVVLRTPEGEVLNVPVHADDAWLQAGSDELDLNLHGVVDGDLSVAAVVLPKVSGEGIAGTRVLRAQIDEQGAETQALLYPSGTTSVELVFDAPVVLRPDTLSRVRLSLLDGPPVALKTSVIANEHWDDPLPLRMDGKDPFWNWYAGLGSSPSGQMNLYDNDTPEKRLALLDWLDEADIIALSSNRLYASIARLPQRYPLTVAYYEALMDGSLGYELAAEFVSYPTLFGCRFPDQENPFDLVDPRVSTARACNIRYPPAEEAFSVYDHPTVLIFRKTEDYSRTRTQLLLPRTLTDDAQWLTPREATAGSGRDAGTLVASPRVRYAQEQGGTWSQLFNRHAWHNRSERLAIVAWALLLTLLGWLAFPFVQLALPDLRAGAYGLARMVGLLLWSYVAWLLASLHLLPHTRTTLWITIAALALGSLLVAYARRDILLRELRENWREILMVDGVFIALFLAFVWIRWLNPDLWHNFRGGEKPMDFAYFNAVIRSTWMPPYDPWFAGGNLNYYYFGFVMMGSLTEALGIVPSVAYNLSVASLFALTGVGAYTLAANLAGGDAARARRAGLWGVLLILILGNLGNLRLVANGLIKVGGVQFESLIPGYPDAVSFLVGLWKVIVEAAPLPYGPESWYWDATRIIPILPGEIGPINEFPAFTFLYADLHAHMMALPLTQIALAVALQWALLPLLRRRGDRVAFVPSLMLGALAAGALRATNTWDYPTYLALMGVGLWIGLASHERAGAAPGLHNLIRVETLLVPILLLGLAELLFRPFTANYQGAYAAFELWQGSRTPLMIYLWMYGHFLLPIVVGGLLSLGLVWVSHPRLAEDRLSLWAIGLALLSGIVLLAGYVRVSLSWLIVPLGALATALLVVRGETVRRRVLWFWVGTALALSLLVEVSVLKGDIGRMNTVFKFHLQVWMLLGLAAAVFVERVLYGPGLLGVVSLRRDHETTPARITALARLQSRRLGSALGDMTLVLVTLLVMGAALYPALAVPARVRERWAPRAPRTLDGAAYLIYVTHFEHGHEIPLAADARVIRWLQDNVEGSPTIMEGLGEREYLWGNRISIYTGLPAVVGWRWHQVQQRMVMPAGTVEARRNDVTLFYNTADPGRARAILETYQVRYVVLAPYERATMLSAGQGKFTEMVARGWLEIAYQDEDAVIYRVLD